MWVRVQVVKSLIFLSVYVPGCELSDLFAAVFLGVQSLISFWVCVSGSVISILFVGIVFRCEVSVICLSLYVPGCKVCEWFVSVFCRILCL